jgi:hypothetical protein
MYVTDLQTRSVEIAFGDQGFLKVALPRLYEERENLKPSLMAAQTTLERAKEDYDRLARRTTFLTDVIASIEALLDLNPLVPKEDA